MNIYYIYIVRFSSSQVDGKTFIIIFVVEFFLYINPNENVITIDIPLIYSL